MTLVIGPRRSLSLKLSDTRVYEPHIRLGFRVWVNHVGEAEGRRPRGEHAHHCHNANVRQPHLVQADVRLPGKGNSNSHGTRPVHLIIKMIQWIRTSRLSIKNSVSSRPRGEHAHHCHDASDSYTCLSSQFKNNYFIEMCSGSEAGLF